MKVCIHRGAAQIGGTCVELACQDQRILLDLGLPLDADERNLASLLPPVVGLSEGDPSLLALILSHGHADHWGLVPADAAPTIVAGAATRRILRAASAFVPRPVPAIFDSGPDLVDRKPITIGPFRITPYLVDHSAYDAYALLIEANGRRLFYSGDIRAHGRKASLFERLVRHPPHPIHALLMEGSSLGRLAPGQQFPTEAEIEARLVERLGPVGFVGVCASAQNIDRVISLYRACKRTGRTLVLDLYAMEVLRATGNANVPAAGWPNLAVYVPEYQRRHIARTERFDLVDRYKQHRLYRETLGPMLGKTAMLLRPAMLPDLDLMAGAWDGARVIWSQWDGYLDKPDLTAFQAKLSERHVTFEIIHTSGHASTSDLQRLAAALAPDALVPIHTFRADQFAALFGSHVTRRGDGEWWEV
ncbi:MBL fold metallo-hydrolase [Lichenicoccus sp.]|uniref:MBL fold metallo-hydrolase n=1 Tax=Lichenicoccus sp. TaxID=2781899 RepID=UPI003D09DE55